jgi:transcriptional regulator with XRE-family HTH domain
MTQGQLAAKLSIGPSNLSYIERGERDVSISLLEEISGALKCKPEYFLRDFQDAA